ASYRASDNGALREPGDRTTWLTVLRTSSSTITRACAVDGFTGRSLSDHVPALFQAGPRRSRWPRSPGRAAAGSAHGAPAPSRRSLGVPPAGARSVAPGSSALPRPRVGAAAPSEQRDVCHVTPARASRARIEQPGSGVPAPRRPTAEVPRQEPTSPRPRSTQADGRGAVAATSAVGEYRLPEQDAQQVYRAQRRAYVSPAGAADGGLCIAAEI